MLFQLIKALSRSEKRYFKLFAAQRKGVSNYVRLFDAIDGQDSYDEAAIRAKFEGETFTRQLHVTKNHLKALVLKSLRNYHASISKDAEVKDLLRNVEVLFHKELYALCTADLARAHRIASKFELDTSMVEILNWQRKIEQVHAPHHYDAFTALLKTQQRAIDRLQNTNQYWQLAVTISQAATSNTPPTPQNEPLLLDPASAHSLEARVLFYNTKFFQSIRENKSDEARGALFNLIDDLESQPARIQEDPALYLSSLNNFVSYLVFNKAYEEALVYLQKAQDIYTNWRLTNTQRTLLKHIVRSMNIELEIYRDTQSFDMEAISRIEAFIQENKNKMSLEYLTSFWFQLAYIYFCRRSFGEALHWINEILNMRNKHIRPDLQIHGRMLNLIIHLEQQNLFVLRYFVDSTQRFLKKSRALQPYEQTLLKFFSSIAKAPILEYRKHFITLNEALFPEDGAPLIPSSILDYIDYKSWVNEHI